LGAQPNRLNRDSPARVVLSLIMIHEDVDFVHIEKSQIPACVLQCSSGSSSVLHIYRSLTISRTHELTISRTHEPTQNKKCAKTAAPCCQARGLREIDEPLLAVFHIRNGFWMLFLDGCWIGPTARQEQQRCAREKSAVLSILRTSRQLWMSRGGGSHSRRRRPPLPTNSCQTRPSLHVSCSLFLTLFASLAFFCFTL
jgi:hypothetical protein